MTRLKVLTIEVKILTFLFLFTIKCYFMLSHHKICTQKRMDFLWDQPHVLYVVLISESLILFEAPVPLMDKNWIIG